jgi:DNA-directed RNA polymerase-5 subunit 1
MVAKDVLKDHLILVANSMTCTGNLIGFNTSGYKATFRSLKVQVPFTESTLFVSLYLPCSYSIKKYISVVLT